jgi:hypothetical protein
MRSILDIEERARLIRKHYVVGAVGTWGAMR